ncbi:EAL domain-containing protein [Shewanella sp. MBTL60-007]|uniref:EAL domain-containing protein n=1 Tax=Shewanella sp. MBTL60-007 TaxID=2815911 RepID=UPI001BB94C4F|nr:EAL domain-containing protein [Shewanella sp. MBTL60-007]GIU31470.1 hypothetical protein TUM3792_43220 [Shewanella sp. MBTL60-007]
MHTHLQLLEAGIDGAQLNEILVQGFHDDSFKYKVQPVVDVSGGVEFYEILSRVDIGDISFCPFDEELPPSLTKALDLYAIKKAYQLLQHSPSNKYSVNIEQESLLDSDFMDRLRELTALNGDACFNLIMEVTERGVPTEYAQQVSKSLNELNKLGYLIALDDVGAGHNPLDFCRQNPIAYIKLDATFVHATTPMQFNAIRAAVALSKPLGAKVVAEGIDSDATYSKLIELGIALFQGYLLGKPQEIKEPKWS